MIDGSQAQDERDPIAPVAAAEDLRGATAPFSIPPRRASSGRMLPAALGSTVAASAAPYGYTISIWSAGALLMGRHGIPQTIDVFGFLAGALIGYGLLVLLARRALADVELIDHPPDRVIAGAMNWFAVGAAVGAAALIASFDASVAWMLAAFATTTVYMLSASAQLVIVSVVTRRRSERTATRSARGGPFSL